MSTKNQKKNQQKKENANKNAQSSQRPNGAASRRRRRKQNMKVQGRENKGFVTVDNPVYQIAEGDRTTIMVDVPCKTISVEAFPLAFLSVALAKGFNNTPTFQIYDAYVARMDDIIKLMKAQTPEIPTRLSFENKIDATYVPKVVPFATGTIATTWTNTDAIGTPSVVSVRSYNYYMYVPSNSMAGSWRVMVAPSINALEDCIPILSKMYNYISSDMVPHLRYVQKLDLAPDYSHDISGFGSGSNYYGGSSSDAGGPARTVEWETPVKAPLLSVFSSFSPTGERASKYLKNTGGDATFVNGVALFPGFTEEVFKTKKSSCTLFY